MIVGNINELVYSNCENASIRPVCKGSYAGRMKLLSGEGLKVRIEEHEESLFCFPHVEACVFFVDEDVVEEVLAEDYALEVARKAMGDGSWRYVKVCIHSGITCFRRTWMINYAPSRAEMDEFFDEAALFAETHLEEVRSMAHLHDGLSACGSF